MTVEQPAQKLLSSALADAEAVLHACLYTSGRVSLLQCNEGDSMFSRRFNSNTQKLAQVTASLTSLHPALQHNDGLDWSLDRNDYLADKRVIDMENPQVGSSLDFPTPFSLLRTFPPAPPDPAQWSTSFFTNCCPVRPRLRVRRGLLKACGVNAVRKNDRKKVITPEPPATGASAEEVAAYVCQAEAQLGPLLHSVAPVAAATTQKAWPWVGGGIAAWCSHGAIMLGMEHQDVLQFRSIHTISQLHVQQA
jgi:hypothetical protein